MNEEKARLLIVEFLYDEISTEDSIALKQYLKDNPERFEEFKDLRKIQKLLHSGSEIEQPSQLQFVEPRERSFATWLNDAKVLLPYSGWGKATLAAAACLLLLLTAGSVASLQVSSNKAGFSLSMGYNNKAKQPPADNDAVTMEKVKELIAQQKKEIVEQTTFQNTLTEQEAERYLSEEEAEALFAHMQKQNKALLTAFAKQMNEQDQQQLQKIVKYFQAQRMYDLKRIKESLTEVQLVQLAGAYRWQQTNRVLGKFIQTTNVEK